MEVEGSYYKATHTRAFNQKKKNYKKGLTVISLHSFYFCFFNVPEQLSVLAVDEKHFLVTMVSKTEGVSTNSQQVFHYKCVSLAPYMIRA